MRFQGGHNAGHTLVIGGETYKLSLLPSGVVRPGKLAVIGNGVVLDPHALVAEIERLRRQGVAIDRANLRIADNATLILSLHRELDALRESGGAGTKIGTTRRGIGPAYEDKVGRRAIRLMDLADLDALHGKVERLLAHHNALRRGFGLEEFDAGAVFDELASVAPKVLPYMDATWRLLDEERRAGKRILFEGAQGALLDVDHGTYPFVTSSNTVAGQAATGSGLGPEGDRLRARHRQGLHDAGRRGAVPDRAPRRDRRAHRPARARVRHRHRAQAPLRLVRRRARAPDRAHLGHRRHRADEARHPRRARARSRSAPATGSTARRSTISRRAQDAQATRRAGLRGDRGLEAGRRAGARSWAELPAQAIKYVRRIEELIGAPVALLSTWPERDDTILVQNPFEG